MPSHDPEDDHLLPTGYRLEEFEIVRVLGEGGFGIAYLAFDHTLNQQRVLKEFLPGQVARRDRSGFLVTTRTGVENRDIFSEGLRSFISEARLLASLDHPHVVRVYRCLEANGTAYLVMHYYQGQTLKERIQALGDARPAAEWVLRLLVSLLRGLDVVHAQGVLHRDLKPDNIYLLADDRPVLIDFGAARRVIGGRTKALTGVITEGYSPIEQYIGDGGLQEGPWTDLYALGATLYWLISGNKPRNAIVRMTCDALSPAATAGQALYPTRLLASIDRALAIQPGERYPTAAAWLADLEDATVRVADVAARRPSLKPPPPAPSPAVPPPPPADPIPRTVESAPRRPAPSVPTPVPVRETTRRAAAPPPASTTPTPASGRRTTSLDNTAQTLVASPPPSGRRRYGLGLSLLLLAAGVVGGHTLWPAGLEPRMARVPGGCFQMGSPVTEAGRIDERERQHRVCVEAFEIGKYEVTQGEWRAMMGSNPSGSKRGDLYPVENASWHDVQDYLQRLNQRTGKTYRLPSEAEWEYACRSGRAGDRYCGGDDVDLVAWYRENSGGHSQPVGRKMPNGFGLYDMSGNVSEWTCSLYDESHNGTETHCTDRPTGDDRSVRGGSWNGLPAWVRSANRYGFSPTSHNIYRGFRLARSL